MAVEGRLEGDWESVACSKVVERKRVVAVPDKAPIKTDGVTLNLNPC